MSADHDGGGDGDASADRSLDGVHSGRGKSAQESAEGMDLSVLIVDDDAGIRRSYAKLLRSAGFTALAVDSALTAFEELKQRSFDAILLDIQMPGLTGSSFFEQLVDTLPHMARRVVFISGFVDMPGTREFLAKSGRPFLGKPPKRGELVRVVRQVVESSARESGGLKKPADDRPESSD